jgi:hypothetical protein
MHLNEYDTGFSLTVVTASQFEFPGPQRIEIVIELEGPDLYVVNNASSQGAAYARYHLQRRVHEVHERYIT